jgi:rhomboid protease GluP
LQALPDHQSTLDTSIIIMLAFCGRTAALQRLLKTRLPRLHPDTKEFWLGTSERAAGDPIAARTRLDALRAKTQSALMRAEIAQRLSAPPHLTAPLLTPPNEATVQRFERTVDTPRGSFFAPKRSGISPAVLAFITLNTLMFLGEILYGGPTNSLTLHRLGALEPYAVLARGEYWRLFAALFLHYGALHLLFNCYALYILGPPLENVIGSVRFAISYLLAGLGSSIGVVVLWRFNWTQADFLVGASGSVMGIVGAWAGVLLRNRHVPSARRRLKSIGLIIALQTAFDLYTPQVSMAAHLCGLITGIALGLLLAPDRRKTT